MGLPVKLKPIPLWRGHWGEQALRKRCSENERAFNRGFRLQAFSDDEATFPSFKGCRVPGIVLGDIIRNNRWPAFTGVDLSGKKRPGNCIFTAKVDPTTRRRYPVDVRFGKWRGSEVCEHLNEIDQQFKPIVIMVEDNAYQESLIDWVSDLKSRFPFWVKVEATTTTGGKKGDAEKGLPGLEVEFKNKAWVVPYSEYEEATRDDPAPAGHWARWDYEFAQHPIAATTDGVMATWFARQGIEIFGGFGLPEGNAEKLGDVNVR
jgi:hypothetical protein